ncbi:MAG: cytochrome c biogenesis protein CcdA [Myxococcaceae bacterium]
MLFSSFLAGLLSSLSPCVYPLIPITLSVIGARRYESHLQGFLVSGAYVSGMVLLYTGLGIVFASLGYLAGSALQSPWVNAFVALLLGAMALNLLGVFTWTLPSSWNARLTHTGAQDGYKGAFMMGLVAGVIAAPCTGPILATILTLIAERHDLKQGTAAMFAYGLGMGLPFLVLGTFSSAIHRIPKSGPWMNRIKFVLGLLMLLVTLHYGKLAYDGFTKDRSAQITQAIEAQIREAKIQNKHVILDFWADWCTLCHELDEKTLKNPEVIKALKNYVIIRVDVSVDSTETKKLQQIYGVVGLPTLVFEDTGKKINGFIKAKDFIKVL